MKKLFVFFLFCLCISVIQAQTLSREISFKSIGKATISGQTDYTYDGSYGTEYYVGTQALPVFRLYSGLAPSGYTYIQLSDADSFVVSQVQVDYSVRNYPNTPPNVIINATDQNYSSNSEAWENNTSFTQLSSVIGNGTITLSSIYNTNAFNTIKGWLEAKKKVYFGARSSNESYLDQLMSKITVTVTYTRKFNLSVQLNQVIGDSSAVHVNGKTVYSGFVNTVADVFGFPENASVTIAAVQSLTTGQGTFGLTNMVRNSTVISTSTDIFPITATTNVTVNYRKSVNGTFATKADYIHQGQNVTNEDISGSTIQMYEGATLLKDIATTTPASSLTPANASLKFITVYGTSGQQNNYKSYSDVNIKNQNWNDNLGVYKLDTLLSTTTSDINLTSRYKQLQSATVQLSLDGIVQSNSGVQFQDPWKVVSGSQPRAWDSYSVSFTPGTGNYASYGGVFLGVDYFSNKPNDGYYRGKTDLTKTIDGSYSKFTSWSTSNATAYSPTVVETPIKFDASGATVTANYKGNLRTGRPDLADTKNQRRVISSGSAWALVYESMGDIWLTTSGDGGANWVTEVRLNTQQGAASNPTFSNVLWYDGTRPRYLVAWIEPGTGGTAVLHFQTVQLYPGLPVYWGWGDYPANNQDTTNHTTLDQIPRDNQVASAWPLRYDARPVVQLTQVGSSMKTYIAFESANNGIQTGIVITPHDFLDTYLEGYGLPVRWMRNASTYLSVQYPVIITYPTSYGYPAKTYVYYLTGGYASGLRIAQYDYDTSTESVLPNPNNDYTYYSLQGAASPGNNTYGLVAEALYYSQYNVNYYYKPTYYGSSAPSLNTVYSNMRQPAIMFEQSSGFGSSSSAGTVVMKSTIDNTFYQSPSLSAIGTNIAGIFAKEQVVSGDRSSIVVKTTTTPATLVRYSGSGLAKEASKTNAIVKAVRLWNDKSATEQRLILDFSDASVVFLDTLEHNSDICVVKVDNWKNSIVRQNDSLCTPLAVALKRNGTTLRSYPASLWKNLTATSLPGIQSGDVITFTLPGESKAFGYSVIALAGNSLPKGNADEDVLTPTEKSVAVYPNPFNPTTTFKVSLPQPDRVQLAVYNSLGQKVEELLNEEMQAGEHFVSFDGGNLSSGAYFYRITIGDKIQSGKLLLMK